MRVGAGIVCMLLWLGGWAGAAPPRPSPQSFVADYAALLPPQQKAALVHQVQEQNERTSSHLFVITVRQLKSYGESDIQEAAKASFPAWGMGDADMLLLLSLRDRKARIQPGSNWGPRWDVEMERIMRDVVVPACQQEDYGRALSQGTQRLLIVTAAGPDGPLPAQNWYERLENLGAYASRRSKLPWRMCLAFMGSGTFLLLLSLFPMGSATRLFAASLGVILLVSSVAAQGILSFFWIALGLAVVWVAGSAIQAGFQSGASLAGGGGMAGDADDYRDSDSGSSADGFGSGTYSSGSTSSSSGGEGGGGVTGSW